MRYEDGSVAQVTSSVVHHGEEQGITLQCADAKISAPWKPQAEITQSNGFPVSGGNKDLLAKLEAFYQEIPDLPYEGHTGEIDDVLTALEKGTRPLITGVDGRKTVELISAIYKAGCEKIMVKLPLEPSDPYYTFEGILKHATRFYEKSAAIENFEEQTFTLGNYK